MNFTRSRFLFATRIDEKSGSQSQDDLERRSSLAGSPPARSTQLLFRSAELAARQRLLLWLIVGLGLFSFAVLLASHNLADWDLWAKLALGAHVWQYRALPHHDLFAFTTVLPQ